MIREYLPRSWMSAWFALLGDGSMDYGSYMYYGEGGRNRSFLLLAHFVSSLHSQGGRGMIAKEFLGKVDIGTSNNYSFLIICYLARVDEVP